MKLEITPTAKSVGRQCLAIALSYWASIWKAGMLLFQQAGTEVNQVRQMPVQFMIEPGLPGDLRHGDHLV